MMNRSRKLAILVVLAILLALCAVPVSAQSDFWQQTNGPLGGSANLVAVNRSTASIFITIEGQNGLFRSVDSGASWQPSNLGLPNQSIVVLVINADGHLFAGVEDRGVFRSTDDGATWSQVLSISGFDDVTAMVIDLQTGDIFVATNFVNRTNVFRSTDNGENWATFETGLSDVGAIQSLAINPLNAEVIAGASDAGILRSDDRGESWQTSNDGLLYSDVKAVAVTSGGTIFASADSSTTRRAIFRSTDNGDSWILVLEPAREVRSLAVNSRNHVFATTHGAGILRSDNNGVNWTTINEGLRSLSIQRIDFGDGDEVLAASHCTGVFRSTNNGGNWQAINGELKLTSIISLAFKPQAGHLLAGSHCGGVFRTADDGETWDWLGPRGQNINALVVHPNGDIFAGTGGVSIAGVGDVYRSGNDGATWVDVSPDNDAFFSMTVGPNGDIYTGTGFLQLCGINSICDQGDIYRTSDNGGSWDRVATKLDDFVLGLAANSGGRVFAATREGTYRSFGEFWHKVLNGNSLSAAVDPLTDLAYVGTTNGVFRSADEGESWTNVLPLSDDRPRTIAFDASGRVLVGTEESGVFRSQDQGETWETVNSGLTTMDVRAIALNTNTGQLFTGVAGNGVFRGGLATQLPNQVTLISPPNDTIIETDSVQFIWQRSQPAVDRYWFEIATDASMANAVIDSTLMAADTVKVVRELLNTQTYWWRVRAGDAAGWGLFSEQRRFDVDIPTSVHADDQIPVDFSLSQNYPNPFNPSTTIEYTLPKSTEVKLIIYDVGGKEIVTLVRDQQPAGGHQVRFEATGLASGLYFYRLETREFVQTKKLTLLK